MSRRWLTGFFFLGAAWLGASCGGDEKDATCQGADGCACYGNSTCDPGLECQSGRCAALSSGGAAGSGGKGNDGGSNNTGGSGNTGGSSNTGGSGNAGGSSNTGGSHNTGGSNNTGGNASGGTNAGGSSTGGSTQSGGTGGSAGSAGAGGASEPAFGPCFVEDDGFETCDDACTSIGETCAEAACNGDTWRGWGIGQESQCMQLAGADTFLDVTCDEPLEWAGNSRIIRCCCSDTQ